MLKQATNKAFRFISRNIIAKKYSSTDEGKIHSLEYHWTARQLLDNSHYDLILQEQISGFIAISKRPEGAKLLKLIKFNTKLYAQLSLNVTIIPSEFK